LWQIIIKQKIFNQASILAKYNKNEAYEKLILYVDEVLMNDSTNREGFSAKVYFNALFGAGFDRRNEEIEPNGTLNYVYSMLLSLFSRYISGYGYSNQLGI
jgi:CRISPR/Cas system-associated endonuclease Cas1